MAEPFVHVQQVHKEIRGQTIIDEVTLSVRRGEVVALCGGNGAGKSTLLRMVAGILHPTRGTITIGGLSWKEDRRRYTELFGYMPDDFRFSPGLTAMEVMAFWAKLRGLDRRRASEVLAEVGLGETGAKPVASFSKGMRQRVLFAQAMLARPPLLIMDEPTNGLDPYWINMFVTLIRKAAANGQTVLFSTHQLVIAEALADRIVLLRGGKIAAETTREELRRSGPDHARMADWFGIPVV